MSRIDDMIEELRSQMKVEIEAAYQRGLVDGAAQMRDRILSAAQGHGGPVAIASPAIIAAAPRHGGGPSLPRAPRGAVGRMLEKALTDMPGLTTTELEQISGDYDGAVATKSIGNELRRFQDKKYRRDERGRWFLIDGGAVETETAGESPAVLGSQEGGGNDEAP
ncbi:hypothetical protein [Bosea sp. (in: a-proteobacteria)]|uniref:hypothetical protein n=1 Tax=Bosea sp. (in: a-proteobacteria) TaxID=1871050 RepID=UPI0027331776|nr:hypothetical protein [Bosea sp. (in: a-proteobacteria)]MDP3408105.1 hypothetical protein [Bosea sp. (in: a-proteobacteria)]